MKKIFIYGLLTALFSCCSYLDYSEYTDYEKEDVYSVLERSKQSLTEIYSCLPASGYGNIGSSMRAAASDECVYIDKMSSIYTFNDGTWSPFRTVDGCWNCFAAIRKANMLIEEMNGQDFEDIKNNLDYENLKEQFDLYQYEARFLRAYFHFELFRRYGDVPIITSVLTRDEANSLERDSYTDVVKFIVKECNAIIPHLPVTYKNVYQAEIGRVTKGTAMALKSRVLLYAASELFNPKHDRTKWKQAAAASGNLIAQANEMGYIPLPALNKLVNQLPSINNELIFGIMNPNDNSFERQNFPVGIDGGGNTGHCPTQNLVDSYEMRATGLPVIDTDYASADPNYDDNNPYEGRDPRLAAAVAVNNSIWVYHEPVQIWTGGKSGKPVKNATLTGYYLKKYVRGETSLKFDNVNSYRHIWSLFRFSEILLNYAEAMVEGFGDYNYKNPPLYPISAKEAVDIIRNRAGVGMPPFPSDLTPKQFMAKLKNERRVELAFEDHRFWDVRRWKEADECTDIYGMTIIKNDDGTFDYKRVLVEKRIFEEWMYLYPIPQTELDINPSLEQNPGW